MLQVSENTMTSWDGTELFYSSWLPEKKAERAIFCFTADTSIPAAGRMSSTSSIYLTSPSSPGTSAGTVDHRGNADTRKASAT